MCSRCMVCVVSFLLTCTGLTAWKFCKMNGYLVKVGFHSLSDSGRFSAII